MSDHEFNLRGRLALLKCWHRLTAEEVDDLIAFVGKPIGYRHTAKDGGHIGFSRTESTLNGADCTPVYEIGGAA